MTYSSEMRLQWWRQETLYNFVREVSWKATAWNNKKAQGRCSTRSWRINYSGSVTWGEAVLAEHCRKAIYYDGDETFDT